MFNLDVIKHTKIILKFKQKNKFLYSTHNIITHVNRIIYIHNKQPEYNLAKRKKHYYCCVKVKKIRTLKLKEKKTIFFIYLSIVSARALLRHFLFSCLCFIIFIFCCFFFI